MIGFDSRPALSEPTDRLKILANPPPCAGGCASAAAGSTRATAPATAAPRSIARRVTPSGEASPLIIVRLEMFNTAADEKFLPRPPHNNYLTFATALTLNPPGVVTALTDCT